MLNVVLDMNMYTCSDTHMSLLMKGIRSLTENIEEVFFFAIIVSKYNVLNVPYLSVTIITPEMLAHLPYISLLLKLLSILHEVIFNVQHLMKACLFLDSQLFSAGLRLDQYFLNLGTAWPSNGSLWNLVLPRYALPHPRPFLPCLLL